MVAGRTLAAALWQREAAAVSLAGEGKVTVQERAAPLRLPQSRCDARSKRRCVQVNWPSSCPARGARVAVFSGNSVREQALQQPARFLSGGRVDAASPRIICPLAKAKAAAVQVRRRRREPHGHPSVAEEAAAAGVLRSAGQGGALRYGAVQLVHLPTQQAKHFGRRLCAHVKESALPCVSARACACVHACACVRARACACVRVRLFVCNLPATVGLRQAWRRSSARGRGSCRSGRACP